MNEVPLFSLEIASEQDVVLVRQRARELAGALGFDRQTQTSVATGLSEIARNAYQYAGGGKVDFFFQQDRGAKSVGRESLGIRVEDHGPGISHLDEVLGGHYRSRTGMGVGITGTRRLMDSAEFHTSPAGTIVTLTKMLPRSARPHSAQQLQDLARELHAQPAPSPINEVRLQNQELIRLIDETRTREEELRRVNEELAETNTGVLALYDELETLHRIGTTLASKLELKSLIQTIIDVTTSLTNATVGLFYFRNADNGAWTLFTSSPSNRLSEQIAEGEEDPDFFGDLANAGLLHLKGAELESGPPSGQKMRSLLNVRSMLAVPVIDSEQVVIGALAFVSEKEEGFSERSERILTSVAAQASVGIEKARLFQSVTAASQAKDQFLAMLSHELRTPLNPVLAIVSGLQDDPRLPIDVAEEIAVISRNIRLEARLIDDLLDFNRLIKGKVAIERSPIDVHVLINNVMAMCGEEFAAKSQRVEMELAAAKSVVSGESARLQQILWNVLRNANKFTPVGGRITITTSTTEGGALAIRISDTGVGIERAALESIFRAFDQGSVIPNTSSGGLGLGLAIARMFTALHQGTIVATSEGKGKGTTFVIELPLADLAEAPANLASSPARQIVKETGRILLVDDHADTLRSLGTLLKRQGFDVVTAATGQSALHEAKEAPFDLLISDLGLPDCSGIDLLTSIRHLRPMPAIALSGYGMQADLDRSEKAGFQAHLIKPVEIDILYGVIQSVLAAARSVPS